MALFLLKKLNQQAPCLSQFLLVRHVLRRNLLNHLPPAHLLLSSTKLTHALRGSQVSSSLGPSSYCPYSPECVEKLFGNSELIPNRGYEAAKRGQRSPDRLPLGAKEECSRHLLLFSKQFRKKSSAKFAQPQSYAKGRSYVQCGGVSRCT